MRGDLLEITIYVPDDNSFIDIQYHYEGEISKVSQMNYEEINKILPLYKDWEIERYFNKSTGKYYNKFSRKFQPRHKPVVPKTIIQPLF